MLQRYAALTLWIFIIPCALLGTYDPLMGVWNLNVESPQTKFSPGHPAPKSQTYKFEDAGAEGIKVISDTVAADGNRMHEEYVAQLDGKDYLVRGNTERVTAALKRVKPFITEGTTKKSGEVTRTFSIVIWGNGLLMTITSKELRAGKIYENIAVYNKVLQ